MQILLDAVKSIKLSDHMGPMTFLIIYGILCIAVPFVCCKIFQRRRGFPPLFVLPINIAQMISTALALFIAGSKDLSWPPALQLALIIAAPILYVVATVLVVKKLRAISGITAIDIFTALVVNILAPLGVLGVIVLMIVSFVLKFVIGVLSKFGHDEKYKYDQYGNKRPD